VADIQLALHAVDMWKLIYVPREINNGAHALARLATEKVMDI
jgi:hypothetical protein